MSMAFISRLLLVLALAAAPAWTGDAPAALLGYGVAVSPDHIAPTLATRPGPVEVLGQPRLAEGHPCTLWDRQDIADLRQQLTGDSALQQALAALKTRLDERLAKPLGVPAPGGPPPTPELYRLHAANADAISDLGTLYVLTGDGRYGDYARRLLVAYAQAFPQLPRPAGWSEVRYRSAVDGRLTGQFLEDGFWLIRAARGADLVHDLPGWTAEERRAVNEDLFAALCSIFTHPVLKERDYLGQTHNRSAVCAAGVLLAGYASDNQRLIDLALYGVGGSRDHPLGGILGTHVSPACIWADGLWNEGALGYQLGIASAALMVDAETLWHHGIDLYRHRDGLLKRLLDSPLGLAYPDQRMTVPALHDSGVLALLDDRQWFSNEAGMPYEYGYRRYRDPRYLPIIRNAHRQLAMTIHAGPPSLFLPLPAAAAISCSWSTVPAAATAIPPSWG